MKRTDLQKRERELKKAKKKEDRVSKGERGERTVGDYIDDLATLLFHDDARVYNIQNSLEILEFLEDMKNSLDGAQWDNVIRKAVKKTGVTQRDQAVDELKALLGA